MIEDKDQRSTDRIVIPGAVVLFRRRNKLGIFERFSRPMKLYNITKSGICFTSDKEFNRGEKFWVEVIIPGEKTLRLIGDVKWIENDYSDSEVLIGAQFAAFGKGRNYNSLKSLERLRTIQEKFSNS